MLFHASQHTTSNQSDCYTSSPTNSIQLTFSEHEMQMRAEFNISNSSRLETKSVLPLLFQVESLFNLVCYWLYYLNYDVLRTSVDVCLFSMLAVYK